MFQPALVPQNLESSLPETTPEGAAKPPRAFAMLWQGIRFL